MRLALRSVPQGPIIPAHDNENHSKDQTQFKSDDPKKLETYSATILTKLKLYRKEIKKTSAAASPI